MRARSDRCTGSSSALLAYAISVTTLEVLGELDGEPVLVRDGRFLLSSFHPELTDDTRVHHLFLEMVREERHVRA